MNRAKAHELLSEEIMLAVGSMPNIRVWGREVGVGRAMKTNHVIRFGTPGEADIQGLVYPGGRFLAIEVKTGKAVLSDKQKRWKAMVEKFGGIYIVGRSVEQVLTELKKYL